MAQIPPPKRSTKGAPPSTDETLNNLEIPDTGDLAPMNFKVEPAFKKEYKIYASRLGISMKELLDRSFREYQRGHPLND
jgi:hypothetical protein